MIRLLVLLAVARCAGSVTEPSLDEIINQIFGISPENTADLDDAPLKVSGCSDLEGKGRGCYECFFCNHTLIQNEKFKEGQLTLQLKDASCSTTPICCVAQQDLVNYRSSDNCGKSNPDGKPRKRRPAPRAVLQGEFPWRAWLHKKNSASPLCAATYVHEDRLSPALVTLASCVQGLSAEGLEVAFVRGGPRSAVREVIVHPGYTPGQNKNNIAVLTLRGLETTPLWVSPACLPLSPPSHAASCITTSTNDIRLNTVIPLRKACTENKEALPDSLTCAVAPPNDYPPDKAAGLFCKEQYVTSPVYILHGLAISQQDDSVTTYINVSHFTKWINDKLGIPN